LDANKKEDFFNMTRKYDIRVKTKEDIEEEKREKERILQEQYERERQRRLEMERIERERNANKGLTIQINQGGNSSNPQISIMTNPQVREAKEAYASNNIKEELGFKEREENDANQMIGIVGSSKTLENATSRSKAKRLKIVDTPIVESNDQKLDNNLVNIFNKKRMSYIPCKKINEDNYEFGTQKINIKVDGETIRGIY
jgi:aspartyl-tRNA synthetase